MVRGRAAGRGGGGSATWHCVLKTVSSSIQSSTVGYSVHTDADV